MDLVCYELVSPELVRPKLVYSSVVSPSWFCLYGACPSWICQWSFSVLILSVLNYSIKFLRPDFVSIRCLSVLNLSIALRLILRPKFFSLRFSVLIFFSRKNLSYCNKLWFHYPYIFSTQCFKIFDISNLIFC